MNSFFRTFADVTGPGTLQAQADVSVVIPSTMRGSLIRAVQSIFAQNFPGRIQVMIGIDTLSGPADLLDAACARRPSHCVVQALYPGYSTAERHGGVAKCNAGGALRCTLSLLANSPYVAYLDDDNWWHPDHLRSLRGAVDHAQWAYSMRWYVHPATARPICVDQWESVGPGRGIYTERFGGFVDTNCLLINKLVCEPALLAWNAPMPGDSRGLSEDRMVFDYLRRNHWSAGTNLPTAYYVLSELDIMHPIRLRMMGESYAAAGTTEPVGT
jgi:hypothetical protein